MKKIVITMAAIATAAISSFAQGHVNFVNSSTTRVTTNSTVNYLGDSLTGGTIGQAPTSAQSPAGYFYALLAQSYSGGATVSATLANVLSGGWTFTGIYGTNALSAGSISGTADATTLTGMPLAQQNQFVIVGWSRTLLGINDWATFANALQNSSFLAGGYVGISSVGTGTSSTSPAEALFGGTGITSGFTLYSTTPVPEPSTFALAGLGGLALLALRRRK